MDEKFIRRFESFKNSLDSLAEARQRDLSDSFVISGTSAKFSITFDLTWKVMKDILVQYYAITGFVTGSPREVLRQSFQATGRYYKVYGLHHICFCDSNLCIVAWGNVLFRYKPVKHYSSDSSNFSYGGWNDLCTCNWRN